MLCYPLNGLIEEQDEEDEFMGVVGTANYPMVLTRTQGVTSRLPVRVQEILLKPQRGF